MSTNIFTAVLFITAVVYSMAIVLLDIDITALTINMGGKGDKESRLKEIRRVIEQNQPSLIFGQEWTMKRKVDFLPDKSWEEVYDFDRREVTNSTYVLVGWDKRLFDSKVVDQALQMDVEAKVQKNASDNRDLEIGRGVFVKLTYKNDGSSFMVASWHGVGYKKKEDERLRRFKGMVKFMKLLREMQNVRDFIIGGDFNLQMNKDIIKKYIEDEGLRLLLHEQRNEQRNKDGKLKDLKDVFIVSKGMVESAGPQPVSVDTPTLDHDPVLAKYQLKLSAREDENKNLLSDKLEINKMQIRLMSTNAVENKSERKKCDKEHDRENTEQEHGQRKRGPKPDKTKNVKEEDGEFVCSCGKKFTTSRGRSIHMGKKKCT